MVEENEIVSDGRTIATIMNRYFTNITNYMNLTQGEQNQSPRIPSEHILDTVKNHKSVQRIKLANFNSNGILNFSKVIEIEVKKQILNLSPKKVTGNGDILAKILKKVSTSIQKK